jgi:O-6-methylguanine DNA methyltransferase
MPGWGVGEIWVRDGIVVQHELASEELRNGGAGLPAGRVPGKARQNDAGIVSDLCRRIAGHLEGDPTTYDGIVIDLDWATPLQHELAIAARAIPWGEVVSYGELAALAGRPGAARAAGSFCADNRYSLIIPCHRVIAANGIGGYGAAGPALKRRILALEGVYV